MTQPMLNGRLLPPQDFEGDDFTPGAGGAWVTCQDSAAGRMLYYATNGTVDLDGKAIRAAIQPPDSNGVSFGQVAVAIANLTNPTRFLQWSTLALPDVRSRLQAGLGLAIDGYYGAIPAAWRHQQNANFNHAMWISNFVPPNYRVWDPLNKNLSSYGEWIPATAIEPFIRSLSGLCGWFTLESIDPPAEGNPLMNLVPMTLHRVIDIPKGVVLEETPGGAQYTKLSKPATLGYISATNTHYYIADGDAGVYVPRSTPGLVIRTQDLNAGA